MIKSIEVTKQAQKQLKKTPTPVKMKFLTWMAAVEERGIEEIRKIPGYHDEPLKGDRKGQRSIRLNIQWRAIYIIINDKIEFIEVQEVTPHDY